MAETIYLAIEFFIERPEASRDILLAELSSLPFDTFEESADGLIAFAEKEQLDGIELKAETLILPSLSGKGISMTSIDISRKGG